VGEFTGVDRLFDGDDAGAAFPRAEPDQDLVALRQRLVVQPENPGANSPRVARRGAGMRDDIAAFDEQFTVERDAHRTAGAVTTVKRRHRPALDGLDFCDLAGGHDDDFVAGREVTGFNAARHDAAVVEFVDRLHRQPQRELFQWPRRFEPVDCFDHGRSAIPADPRRQFGDAVAVARGNRNDCGRRYAKAGQVRGNLVADFPESVSAEIDAVHLVDDNRDLPDPEQVQQIAVTSGLVAHAFQRVDDQHRAVRLRGAGDHVAQKFGVTGRVDQHDVARAGAEADLRGVDGDALVALGLQRIEQERPFERHAAPRADRLQHLQLAFGQAAGLVQQASDQGGFTVVDMADDDDADLRSRRAVWHRRGAVRRGRDACGEDHVHGNAHTKYPSEIASDTQPLESVFGLVIESAAGALRHLGAVEFGQDFIDARGGGSHRVGDVLVAQRAIALAVLRQIERDDR